jgi:hypothetical protein
MISVLCTNENSNYKLIPGLDLWPASRDMHHYGGSNPVICHPPCAQWSRMRAFANDNPSQKFLALMCWDIVNSNGGIFEHPSASSFWHYVCADRSRLISVNQSWWGFPCRKTTWLYFSKCQPLSYPLSFIPVVHTISTTSKKYRKFKELQGSKQNRSLMPLPFCQYLVDCVRASSELVYLNSHMSALSINQ